MQQQIDTAKPITEQHASEELVRNRGRWMLLLLLLFFAVPLVLVMLMQRYDWHPQGNSAGDLVIPVRPLNSEQGLLAANGEAVGAETWRDKWSMVYLARDCRQDCRNRLHDMRQVHASLAKDISRIQRVFITTATEVGELRKLYPDLLIINQPASKVEALSQQFEISENGITQNEVDRSKQSASPAFQDKRIYLVDPLGNLMMSFPANTPMSDVRKDLGRLLRYAWAG